MKTSTDRPKGQVRLPDCVGRRNLLFKQIKNQKIKEKTMKEVNVDLLIIGDLACTTYISCTSKGSITCGANLVEITAPNIPSYIDLYNIRFHLKDAIVMDAKGGYVNATSTFAPDGKHIFATGKVCSRGINVKDKYNGTV